MALPLGFNTAFTIAFDAEKHKKTAKAAYRAALGAFGQLVADLLPKEMPILVDIREKIS